MQRLRGPSKFPVVQIPNDLPPEEHAQRTIQKMMARIKITARGCWEWQAFRGWKGYGQIAYKGKNAAAHRVMYALTHGPIPDGYMVCHKCDNPPCCNPGHLWVGTMSDNALDSAKKGRAKEVKKTHCPRNHPLSGDNLYRTPTGKRNCKACARIRGRLKAGWPEDVAIATALEPVPLGYDRFGNTSSGRKRSAQSES